MTKRPCGRRAPRPFAAVGGAEPALAALVALCQIEGRVRRRWRMAGSRLRSFTERIVRAASRRAQLAAAGVLITALLLWKVPQWQTAPWRAFLAPKDLLLVENELRRTLVLLIGAIFGGAALAVVWRRAALSERSARATQEGQRGERFTRAVGQLADARPEVRIGAVYGLEQIAAESPTQHWPVMEVLCAFLRERAGWNEQQPAASLSMDVQAVLTVLGRRNRDHEQ